MTTEPDNRRRSDLLLAGSLCCVFGAVCMYYSLWLFPIYAPLLLAAFVMGVIALAKGRVWSGLGLFLTASIVPALLFIVLLILPSGRELQNRIDEWRGGAPSFSTTDQEISLGETATTPTFELNVQTVRRRRRVGSLFRGETPSPGAVYLVVTWGYKNISAAPVPPRRKPKVTLLSPTGRVYHADVPANKAVAAGALIRGIAASSVNPGIEIRRVDVFEVPKSVAGNAGWQVEIAADQRVAVQAGK